MFQIIFQIVFASFVSKLHFLFKEFFIKKQKALGDFQIIVDIFFALFVPGLSRSKSKSLEQRCSWCIEVYNGTLPPTDMICARDDSHSAVVFGQPINLSCRQPIGVAVGQPISRS